jgi:F-type H+-transporting ATPase subunit beta
MAEYFRDDEHRDVLLLIDNIFRFMQAGMEVSGLMGQMPSRLGYQPTMGTELSPTWKNGSANTDTGCHHIDPGGLCARRRSDRSGRSAHLLASVRVHCAVAQAGERRLYPAIDPLQSNSKMLTPGIVGERHYTIARDIRKHPRAICRT